MSALLLLLLLFLLPLLFLLLRFLLRLLLHLLQLLIRALLAIRLPIYGEARHPLEFLLALMAAVALLVVRLLEDGKVLPRDRLPALRADLPAHSARAVPAVHLPVDLDVLGLDGLLALVAEEAAAVPVLVEGDEVFAENLLLALFAENRGLLDVLVALLAVNLPVDGEELGHGLVALGADKAVLVVKIALHVEVGPFKLLPANTTLELGSLDGHLDALLLLGRGRGRRGGRGRRTLLAADGKLDLLSVVFAVGLGDFNLERHFFGVLLNVKGIVK